MYKVGDKVLIKGEVVEVAKDVTYPIGVRLRCATVPMLFTKEELELSTKTYEMGLNDAWHLAKKIRIQPSNGGIPNSELEEIFGTTFIDTIFKNNTAAEALAKIEAYEKEKNFCVGDEIVTSMDETFIILALADGEVYGYSNDGKYEVFPVQRIECYTESGMAEKTGKHIDIESLLKQIGE